MKGAKEEGGFGHYQLRGFGHYQLRVTFFCTSRNFFAHRVILEQIFVKSTRTVEIELQLIISNAQNFEIKSWPLTAVASLPHFRKDMFWSTT